MGRGSLFRPGHLPSQNNSNLTSQHVVPDPNGCSISLGGTRRQLLHQRQTLSHSLKTVIFGLASTELQVKTAAHNEIKFLRNSIGHHIFQENESEYCLCVVVEYDTENAFAALATAYLSE